MSTVILDRFIDAAGVVCGVSSAWCSKPQDSHLVASRDTGRVELLAGGSEAASAFPARRRVYLLFIHPRAPNLFDREQVLTVRTYGPWPGRKHGHQAADLWSIKMG